MGSFDLIGDSEVEGAEASRGRVAYGDFDSFFLWCGDSRRRDI